MALVSANVKGVVGPRVYTRDKRESPVPRGRRSPTVSPPSRGRPGAAVGVRVRGRPSPWEGSVGGEVRRSAGAGSSRVKGRGGRTRGGRSTKRPTQDRVRVSPFVGAAGRPSSPVSSEGPFGGPLSPQGRRRETPKSPPRTYLFTYLTKDPFVGVGLLGH